MVYALGSTLSIVSSEATYLLLNLFGFPVSISTSYESPTINIIQSNGTPLAFSVDVACSGIYSLIGFLIFAIFVSYVARAKTWKKATDSQKD